MNIREVNQSELGKLLELYRHLHEHDEALPADEVINQTWSEIQTNSAMSCFVLSVQEQMVSSCVLLRVPNLTRGCRPYGVIENVVTHAEHRGHGYGRQILRHALEFAWQHNCYKVMLMTGRLNEETFKFYESVGFNRHSKQAFIAKAE